MTERSVGHLTLVKKLSASQRVLLRHKATGRWDNYVDEEHGGLAVRLWAVRQGPMSVSKGGDSPVMAVLQRRESTLPTGPGRRGAGMAAGLDSGAIRRRTEMVQLGGWEAHVVRVGSGPPLVALHGGLGLDHTFLHPWLDILASSFEVIYLDQRGSGRSSGREMLAATTLADWAEDVERLCVALEIDHVVVFGHSAGGLVALTHARRYPARLRGLILCGAYPALDFLGESLALVRQKLPNASFERLIGYYSGPGGDDDEYRKAILAALPAYFAADRSDVYEVLAAATRFSAAASDRTHAALANLDATPWLDEIVAPILLLAGRQDCLPPPSAGAQRLASAMPNARLHLFERSGHMPYIEEPDAFAAVVTEWLADLGPK